MSIPTTGGFDPEDLIAQVERDVVAAEARAVQAQQFAADVTGMRGEATSPRREVRVTVDLGGKLLDVAFSDDAYELAPRDLAQLVLATAGAAHRVAGRRAMEHAEQLYGENAPVTTEMRREFESRIGSLDETDAGLGPRR